jgi:hypothetical protein
VCHFPSSALFPNSEVLDASVSGTWTASFRPWTDTLKTIQQFYKKSKFNLENRFVNEAAK